jgi:ribonuclease HI
MHAFQLDPDKIEKIDPIRHFPKYDKDFRVDIASERDRAIENASNSTAEIRIFSDGSGLEGGIGAAAVLCRTGKAPRSLHYHLGSDKHHTVYEGEVVGMLLAAHLLKTERNAKNIETTLGVDNQAAITGTDSFKPAPGHYLIDEFLDTVLEARTKSGANLSIVWVPGHEGIEGNELVDEKAKEAAKGASSRKALLPPLLHQPLLHSKSALKQDFASSLKREARDYLKESPRYERITQIDNTIASPGKYLWLTSSLPRNQSSLLFQLRTGHAPLNKHLYRIKRADSLMCPKCKDQEETVMHFLLKCPAYTTH